MATINLVPQVFATPVVNGQAALNQSATANSINDSAQANADMPTAIGIQGEVAGSGVITVAGAGSVLGRVTGSQSTIAGSINSDSAANASIGQAIGIYQRGGESIAVGATGSILGTVDLNQQARSTSVAASANADAITAAVFGININASTGSISTGGSGSVQGLALINTSAVATTVGNNAALDGSTAVQQLGTAAGLDLTASSAPATPTVVIGGLGEVVGAVAASGSATANSTAAGNSSATAGTFDPAAFSVGTLSGIRTTFGNPAVQVAGVASISGSVNADFKAIASSVLGTAQASVDGSAMAVGDSTNTVGGQISIGDDGVFSASADLTSIAQAGTTNGDATARIAPNGQSVVGTALDGIGSTGLSIGGNGRLSSTATARQIGSSATTNGSATTSFEGVYQSSILGISSSDIAVGGSITGLDATASLIANGSATAVLGAATVEATSGYKTIGFDQAALSIAGSSSGGIRASGDAAVQLIAQSTNGDARTTAFAALPGEAFGISIFGNPGGILIGRDADRLDADARQTIRMAASSVNGNLAQALLSDTITYGAHDGPPLTGGGGISVGASAVVDITSTNLVDLSANNVGSSSSNGEAKATISGGTFASEAARQIGISIADQGLIQATATSAGRLTAQSVNGNAFATVLPDSSFSTIGIGGGPGIAAGADGDIRATARMNGIGGINTPYLLQATSAAGNADASFDSGIGTISTIAITTFSNGTTINTGTATGDLSADATSSVGLYATSTSGNATAIFAENAAGKSEVSAIVDSDVRAGSSGRNRVDANAALDLLLNAKTVKGAATATSNSAVNGITDDSGSSSPGGNSIQLAGDISAQARFSNTALARSVQGTATSTATNANVLGVNGYDLTMIGSGGLTGSAHGLMRADAGSVDGNAQAKALL